MGCCASTGAPSISRHVDVFSKSPPSAEEEAVKEVLSETPNQKPISPNPYLYNLNTFIPKLPNNDNSFTTRSSNNGCYLSMTSALDSTPKNNILQSPRKQIDEISDGRSRVPRSPSPGRVQIDPGLRRERLTGKSPVKRSDSSPRRIGSGRGPGQGVQRKRVPGENSGRRSRSPATRNEGDGNGSRSNMGRSPSGRKTGLSPGKIRMVGPGIGPNHPNGGGDSWEMDPTAPSESLENPLVSLECFIFL